MIDLEARMSVRPWEEQCQVRNAYLKRTVEEAVGINKAAGTSLIRKRVNKI